MNCELCYTKGNAKIYWTRGTTCERVAACPECEGENDFVFYEYCWSPIMGELCAICGDYMADGSHDICENSAKKRLLKSTGGGTR
jgi:hypothetical protein